MESYSQIKDVNGRLAQEEDEVRRIWKEYFEDLYNIFTQEEVAVYMMGFGEVTTSDDLVLCGESEENFRAMVGLFAEVCRRRGLKINVGKSKVIVVNRKEGLECEIHIDGIRLEHVSEFRCLWCVWTHQVQKEQSVVGRWKMRLGL